MNEKTADYIRLHADDDVRQLALKGTKDLDVDLPFALDQIAGRQTARRKLPSWAASDGIIYPPHLSMEQCSSEQTARYKARLAGSGRRMADLTGGFGVDFSFMAPAFTEAIYIEQQTALCDIARENFKTLGLNATVVNEDAVEYLRKMSHADLIYLDPARRDTHGQRTYGISDCTPDVLAIRDLLLEKADRVIIKLSPMLDWRKAVNVLGNSFVSEVHIVSVQNECKELLLVLNSHSTEDAEFRLYCVNDDTVFAASQDIQHNQKTQSIQDYQGSYLYEPNASIMKAGCFDAVCETFEVSPLADNSHLFVSNRQLKDFPGRMFCINALTTLNKRELRSALSGLRQANIAVRNFPLSVAQLRLRLKLSEGGSTYIFATTLANGSHVLLLCSKTMTPSV